MQQETFVILAIVVGFFLVMLVTTVRNNRQRTRWFFDKARRSWGHAPDREYTFEEFESIAGYTNRRKEKEEEFFVDDTTWNDLDMDSIFMLINNTVSSCGEEYLYYTLRKPVFHQDELDERNRLIEYFRSEEQNRLKIQKTLCATGKTRTLSIGEYINSLNEAPNISGGLYILLSLAMVAGIGMLFVSPMIGALIILPLMFADMLLHIKAKGKIDIYLKCFQCIIGMCATADGLKKLHIPEISEYTDKLAKARRELLGFTTGSFLVTSGASVADDILSGIMEYVKMIFHVDKIKYNSMLKQLKGHQKDVEELMEGIGILDSCIGIASFREYLPYYARGDFKQSKTAFMEVHDLYHPLIDNPVANSITVAGGVLVTGSNASGKSTFLKTVAINCILAQTVDTAVAHRYDASFIKVLTSMALNDNLQDGESYYIVEIKSLKRILDESQKGIPMLCVVDEVLRGTNTIERIAASTQILKKLNQPGILSFAATHDIELAHLLKDYYTNYHFEEAIHDGDIFFPYKLMSGYTKTRNAIGLLELLGYDSEITEAARNQAHKFETTGEWELC